MSKKEFRMKIFNKYQGHCAYCGKELKHIKLMQIDHIVPKSNGGANNINNYHPACKSCNHYKRAHSLEVFREIMKTLHNRLMKIYIVRVAIDYGIITLKPFDGEFYFEMMEKNE